MRLIRSRLTIGRLMLVVAAFSVASWSAGTAYKVQHDPGSRWVRHVWVRDGGPDDYPNPTTTACVPTFWPQYWRKLLGRPWPGTYACDFHDGPPQLIGIRVGTECRPYRLVETLPVSADEAWQVEACLRSLKTLGPGTTSPSTSTNP